MKKTIVAFLTVFLFFITAYSHAELSSITITDPVIRAVPPGKNITAAYMVINNNSDQPITLIGAESSFAEKVEIHQSVHENGVMKMNKLDKLTVEPHANVVLKPGDYHLMLFGLKNSIHAETHIPITLLFNNRDAIQVNAKINPNP